MIWAAYAVGVYYLLHAIGLPTPVDVVATVTMFCVHTK